MKKILCTFLILSLGIAVFTQAESKDWRVKVVLKNGSIVKGVVLENHFVEKAIWGRVYQAVDNYRLPGAGIRVWYVDSAPGFVFLKYEKIQRVVKLGKLSQKARLEIEKKVRMRIAAAKQASIEEQKKREERLKKAGIGLTQMEEKAKLEAEAEKRAREKITEEEVMNALPAKYRELLTRYPERSWGEDRYTRIKLRRNSNTRKGKNRWLGITSNERYFFDNYYEWITAKKLKEEQRQVIVNKKKVKIKEDLLKKFEQRQKEKKEVKAAIKKQEEKSKPIVIRRSTDDIIQEAIQTILYSQKVSKKIQAIYTLAKLRSKAAKAVSTLRLALKNPSPKVRAVAIKALGIIKEPKELVLSALSESLELGDVVMRRAAAFAFMKMGSDASKKLETLLLALGDDDYGVRYRVLLVLGNLKERKTLRDVASKIFDQKNIVKIASVTASLKIIQHNSQKSRRYGSKFIKDYGQRLEGILLQGIKSKKKSITLLAFEGVRLLLNYYNTHSETKLSYFQKALTKASEKLKEPIKTKVTSLIQSFREEKSDENNKEDENENENEDEDEEYEEE